MFANSNGQEELSALGKDKLQLTDNDKSEYDWYSWIDHLISLEYHKAIEELKADISELEADISELKVVISKLKNFVQRRCQEKLKGDMEIDLKLVKCLYQHFITLKKL
ncbi:hypothetical protein [Wolbachia endosymbiont (group E) of Neria commutata]|uniref:hypothetical protein n=1 Tax=Wolbachia endosymbiont (group E) of Neria commutata TaxID=3066149 RepID=UPI003132E436